MFAFAVRIKFDNDASSSVCFVLKTNIPAQADRQTDENESNSNER